MTDQHQDDHGEYERTSSSSFIGEAAQRLRDAEDAAAKLPRRPDDPDDPDGEAA